MYVSVKPEGSKDTIWEQTKNAWMRMSLLRGDFQARGHLHVSLQSLRPVLSQSAYQMHVNRIAPHELYTMW